jgi:hypothetical protein
MGGNTLRLHRFHRSPGHRRRLDCWYRPVLERLETRQMLSTSVLTSHNDIGRTGQDLTETVLTPANVNMNTFGKLVTYPVDGQIYAQPLYLPGVRLPDGSVHAVVFTATEHDSVYAFDAHGGGLLWQDSFIAVANGITPFSQSDAFGCNQITPEIGITGTPVIDPTTGTIFAVAQTKEVVGGNTTYHQRLHALDVATGAEKFGGPVEIQATFGSKTFDPRYYKARPGLLLLDGVVYTSWSSHCDITPAQGWVIGYSALTLQQVSVFNFAANGQLDTIWQGGGGPAADNYGHIYFETGNGTHGADQGNYSESFVDLSIRNGGLDPVDHFAPFNWATLDQLDEDLGSGGPMVLPRQPGDHPHLLVGAGKEGKVYLLDRYDLGGENATFDRVVQELPAGTIAGGSWDTPAYFSAGGATNRWIYYGGSGDHIKAFQLVNGLLSTSPTSQSGTSFGYPGATPSISANGTTNGIVWAIKNANPAILYAFDALDLSHELYDTSQASGNRDQLDLGVKFVVPTIADGQVFVGTNDALFILGLLPSTAAVQDPALVTALPPVPATVNATMPVAAGNETVLPLSLPGEMAGALNVAAAGPSGLPAVVRPRSGDTALPGTVDVVNVFVDALEPSGVFA